MKLIVISKEKVFAGEPLWIDALMGEYDFTFHLRKPGLTESETEEIILQINSNFHNRIVLHDHFPLAEKYRLKGVHLNSRNPQANFKGEYWNRCSISRSCHSLEEVAVNKDSCNYLTLSPVFDSISKEGYKAGFPEGQEKSKKRWNAVPPFLLSFILNIVPNFFHNQSMTYCHSNNIYHPGCRSASWAVPACRCGKTQYLLAEIQTIPQEIHNSHTRYLICRNPSLG